MKQFTSFFICCFVAFPFLHSCTFTGGREIKGNYHIVNEKMAIGDYDEIVLQLPANVVYRQIAQEEPFLQVSVDDNVLPSLDISVRGKQLVITQNNNYNLHPSRLVIYTNSRNLGKVRVTGSGDVWLEKAVNAGNMEISITGSGDVKTDSLYCETLQVKIIGSGGVNLKGAATHAGYQITGSGDIQAFDYLVQDLNCTISGSGDIQAFVDKKLKARISGSGDILYKGNPETEDKQVSGSGSISKVNP